MHACWYACMHVCMYVCLNLRSCRLVMSLTNVIWCRNGQVTVEDVAEPEKTHPSEILQSKLYNYSKHIPAANRSGEPLRSWPAREVEGNIKIFVGRGKDDQVGEGEIDPDVAERRGLYQHVGRGHGRDGHDISPREIERFLNIELSSGVSMFNVPKESQMNISASIHLHSRSKKRYPNAMMVCVCV